MLDLKYKKTSNIKQNNIFKGMVHSTFKEEYV